MKTLNLKVLGGSEMRCYVNDAVGPAHGGLIVLQEAFGVNAHIQSVLKRFADEGYQVIAPELFHRTAPPGWTCGYDQFSLAQTHFSAISEEGISADVRACYDWLIGEQKVTRVATCGYCLGGRASFIANGNIPLKAAVSYYGGAIAPQYLHLAATQNAPILFFWGGKDKHIPREQFCAVTEALDRSEKLYSSCVISDADHGFFCEDRPAYNAAAAALAWSTTLAFLKLHIG